MAKKTTLDLVQYTGLGSTEKRNLKSANMGYGVAGETQSIQG